MSRFLSIAAHAHADALSVEVRCDGVDILADMEQPVAIAAGKPEQFKLLRSRGVRQKLL